MSSKLASVIIRTQNRAEYLAQAVESVKRQTYPNVEVIVVNDGGAKPDVDAKLVNLEASVGRSRAANIGLEASSGDYICFLDDDDELYPEHLERLISEIESSDKLIAYSDALCASHRGLTPTRFDLHYSVDYSEEKLASANITPIQSVVFSRDALCGGASFDPLLDTLEDWDFWLQLRTISDFLHIASVTSEYRFHGSNTVGSRSAEWTWSEDYVRRKHNLGPAKPLREGFVVQ